MKLLHLFTLSTLLAIPALNATVLTVDQALASTNSSSLKAYLAQETLPVVLKFFSPYCPPCNALGPVFTAFATFFDGKIICIEVNVIANPKEKQSFGVNRWPTLIFYDDGVEVSRNPGKGLSLEALKQLATKIFGV